MELTETKKYNILVFAVIVLGSTVILIFIGVIVNEHMTSIKATKVFLQLQKNSLVLRFHHQTIEASK